MSIWTVKGWFGNGESSTCSIRVHYKT